MRLQIIQYASAHLIRKNVFLDLIFFYEHSWAQFLRRILAVQIILVKYNSLIQIKCPKNF